MTGIKKFALTAARTTKEGMQRQHAYGHMSFFSTFK